MLPRPIGLFVSVVNDLNFKVIFSPGSISLIIPFCSFSFIKIPVPVIDAFERKLHSILFIFSHHCFQYLDLYQ